jgi:hypothetical protein
MHDALIHKQEPASAEPAPHGIHDDWLAVVMDEYRTLRAEIIAALGMQQSALALGALALGGTVLAGLNAWPDEKSTLPLIVFVVVVPLVSYVASSIWLAEYSRAMRAGAFLVSVEEKVNDKLRKDALTWETSLRRHGQARTADIGTTQAVFGFFLAVIPFASVVAANVSPRGLRLPPTERVSADVAELALFVIVAFFMNRAFAAAKEWACIYAPPELLREQETASDAVVPQPSSP